MSIEQLQKKLDELEGALPSCRTPSDIELLKVAVNLALLREVHAIANVMAWGAADDIPSHIPADAGQLALELDEALAEVAAGIEQRHPPPTDCPQRCFECKYENTCRDFVPF